MKRPDAQKDLWFLFAHGAGAPSTSDWMRKYEALLKPYGAVRSFDYPYMKAGKKRPDPQAHLLEAHRIELKKGRNELGPRVVLVGKSMGGRMSCHVAADELAPDAADASSSAKQSDELAQESGVLGVICFGYPLVGIGSSGKLRDKVLLDLRVPLCLLQGTRDKLCPLDLLSEVLSKRQSPTSLHVVQSGDHSLEPTKGHLKLSGETEADLERESMAHIERFLASL